MVRVWVMGTVKVRFRAMTSFRVRVTVMFRDRARARAIAKAQLWYG
jgi:hypothetical protein